jgi:hypothetical protein
MLTVGGCSEPPPGMWISRVVVGLQDHRAGRVPEENAGPAVLVVDEPRDRLPPDQQRAPVAPRSEEIGDHLQPVEEARAGRSQVEAGDRPPDAQVAVQEAGGRRREHVGADRTDHDQIQLRRVGSGKLEGAPRGAGG